MRVHVVPHAEPASVNDLPDLRDCPADVPRDVAGGAEGPLVFGEVLVERTRQRREQAPVDKVVAQQHLLQGDVLEPGEPDAQLARRRLA